MFALFLLGLHWREKDLRAAKKAELAGEDSEDETSSEKENEEQEVDA